jgi:ribosome-associated protein
MEKIYINPQLEIPLTELMFGFARSGGKGGQNVNKVETKVELFFNVAGSPSLSEPDRRVLFLQLAHRLTADGVLRIVSRVHRSQLQNKQDAIEKFQSLIRSALTPMKKRTPTKPSKASRQKRITEKKQIGMKKQTRKKTTDD